MVRQVDLSQWRPTHIVEAALRATLSDFVDQLGTTELLMVKVDNFETKVARGLLGPSARSPSSASIPPFALTRNANTRLIVARIEEARKLRGTRRGIPTTLMLEPRCIVPIRKRGTHDGKPTDSISVGRARELDIVLQDPSVSKNHARFIRERGELCLCDDNSKNGTFVNGVVTTEHQVPVEHGDEVRFGEVEALLSGVEHFWQFVQAL